MTISEKVKKIIRRIFRITLTTILVLFSVILLILLLIQTSPVQNYGRGKIEAYLEKKLHTKVRIGNLYIGLPTKVILKNIYLEDQQKDTLLSGGNIEVDISMLKLLQHEVRLNDIELNGLTLKVKRLMPDTVFNFQFIADAFSSPGKKPPDPSDSTGGFGFTIGSIHLQHIRAVYRDDATGNDVSIYLGDFKTKLNTFDPAHQLYSIPDISLAQVSGRVRQYQPILILKNIADTISEHNKASAPVRLKLGHIGFDQIALDYRNDAERMDAGIRLGSFETIADSIDLGNLRIRLKKVSLSNTTVDVRFGMKSKTPPNKEKLKSDTISHTGTWAFDVAAFNVDHTRLRYRDDNKKPVKKGIDYNHLDVNHLNIQATALHADPANYSGKIDGISLDEKSGLVLNKLSAEASYNEKSAALKDLVIQTSRSGIRAQSAIHYPSTASFSKHPGDIQTDLLFDHSRISMQDVLLFAPALADHLKGEEHAVLTLNGKINGQVKNLHIPYLEIGGIGNTSLAASGNIRGLPDGKKAYYDLVISRLTTSRADLLRIIPAKSFPQNIRIPAQIAANGKFTGTVNRFHVNLQVRTSNGNAAVAGLLDLDRKAYDLTAKTKSADLGYILKQDSLLGKITLDATARGSGFDPKRNEQRFPCEPGRRGIQILFV